MIWLDIAQGSGTWVAELATWGHSWHHATLHLPFDGSLHFDVLAQFDTDPFRGVRQTFGNFFRTGQAWAFLAGIVIGYLIRSFTSYG